MMKFLGAILLAGAVLIGLAVGGHIPDAYLPDAVKVLLQRPSIIASKRYEQGEFKGALEVRFESLPTGDGHTVELVQLIEEFGYTDSNGVEWNVPAGEISDGASIPWPLWAIVGGPYSGPYRQAAVIHDYYCAKQDRPWQDVHKMFLEASLKAGTGETLAKVLYAGILLDGPRWEIKSARSQSRFPVFGVATAYAAEHIPVSEGCAEFIESVKEKDDRERFAGLKVWIEKDKPSLKDIQACVAEMRKKRE